MKKLLFFLTLLAFFSCKDSNNGNVDPEWQKKVNTTLKKWSGEEMYLPKELEILTGHNRYGNPRAILDSDLKIVTFIDGNCSECYSSITFWQNFDKKLKSRGLKCPIVLFIQVEDSENFKKSFLEPMGVELTSFYDKEARFPKKNGLDDKRFQTALLDKENRVVAMGEPVYNQKLEDFYFKLISDQQ